MFLLLVLFLLLAIFGGGVFYGLASSGLFWLIVVLLVLGFGLGGYSGWYPGAPWRRGGPPPY